MVRLCKKDVMDVKRLTAHIYVAHINIYISIWKRGEVGNVLMKGLLRYFFLEVYTGRQA